MNLGPAVLVGIFGAGNESRTRDLNLGKVALYQLSYSRVQAGKVYAKPWFCGNYLRQTCGMESLRYQAIESSVSTAAI